MRSIVSPSSPSRAMLWASQYAAVEVDRRSLNVPKPPRKPLRRMSKRSKAQTDASELQTKLAWKQRLSSVVATPVLPSVSLEKGFVANPRARVYQTHVDTNIIPIQPQSRTTIVESARPLQAQAECKMCVIGRTDRDGRAAHKREHLAAARLARAALRRLTSGCLERNSRREGAQSPSRTRATFAPASDEYVAHILTREAGR